MILKISQFQLKRFLSYLYWLKIKYESTITFNNVRNELFDCNDCFMLKIFV